MNAHDFTTPIKTLLVEKLAAIMPGDFGGFQFYDAGTAAVERAAAAIEDPSIDQDELVALFAPADAYERALADSAAIGIDQGGIAETSRPTSHSAPVFVEDLCGATSSQTW